MAKAPITEIHNTRAFKAISLLKKPWLRGPSTENERNQWLCDAVNILYETGKRPVDFFPVYVFLPGSTKGNKKNYIEIEGYIELKHNLKARLSNKHIIHLYENTMTLEG